MDQRQSACCKHVRLGPVEEEHMSKEKMSKLLLTGTMTIDENVQAGSCDV